jgi:hypothetical protein
MDTKSFSAKKLPQTRLCELAQKYGTDKFGRHNYTSCYHNLLKDRAVRRMLEIGIGTKHCMGEDYQPGASLRMWRDYFPDAEIWGWDCDRGVLTNEHRIFTHYCDQSQYNSLKLAADAAGPFDFIIDDGSHFIEHQSLTANFLIPRMALKGLYVIEDVTEVEALLSLLKYPALVYDFDPSVPGDRLVVIGG